MMKMKHVAAIGRNTLGDPGRESEVAVGIGRDRHTYAREGTPT
jgi:hypothetical protein